MRGLNGGRNARDDMRGVGGMDEIGIGTGHGHGPDRLDRIIRVIANIAQREEIGEV